MSFVNKCFQKHVLVTETRQYVLCIASLPLPKKLALGYKKNLFK